jgi:CRISPR-associated protein Csb2
LVGSPPPADNDQITLLASVPAEEYLPWRRQSLGRQLERESTERGAALTTPQRMKLESAFPIDLLDCLQWDTADIKQHKWNQPPGSRRVLYDRRCPQIAAVFRPRTRRPQPPVEAALIRLAIDRREAVRLPAMTRCLPQAEAIHLALVSILNKQLELSSPAITGRSDDREPLESKHRHAHYVPLGLDDDGSIDHILIHAPMGLDSAAQQAIRHLRRTWAKGISSILLRWVGFGSLDDFRSDLRVRGGGRPAVLGQSTVLESATPYVPPRWLKPRNGRYTIEDDVRRELECRELPMPVQIDVWNHDHEHGRRKLADTRLLSFARTRQKNKPQPPQPAAFGLTLHFDQPVQCPLSIGYASHFGLGLFRAVSLE